MLTSADRQKEPSKQRRRQAPVALHRSPIKVSKYSLCIPLMPMEPISSLSANTQTAVLAGVSISRIGLKAA